MREPELYTTAEAAGILRMKPIRLLGNKRGQLAAVKVGKHWLIQKDTLDAMLSPPRPRVK